MTSFQSSLDMSSLKCCFSRSMDFLEILLTRGSCSIKSRALNIAPLTLQLPTALQEQRAPPNNVNSQVKTTAPDLEIKMAPVQPGGLGCICWFNLHGNRLSSLCCVHWLMVELHAGNAPYLNSCLCWYAQGCANLHVHTMKHLTNSPNLAMCLFDEWSHSCVSVTLLHA